jgi:hypothetical protein
LSPDPTQVARQLTHNERAALLSLPARDGADMSDELWWAYCSILDQGLAASAGNFVLTATPLGATVLSVLRGEQL